MPTEAKRETVAELREELANARTMIVSEYRGLKVKEIAEIRRALRKQDVTLPRRQEPADADRRRGLGRRGAQPAAHRPDRDRVRQRRGRDRQGRPRRDPAVRQGRPDHRRRARRPGDRRRRRHPAGRPAVARGPAGQAGRRDAGAGRARWPACSPPRCATWAMPCSRSPTRRPRPRRLDAAHHRPLPHDHHEGDIPWQS